MAERIPELADDLTARGVTCSRFHRLGLLLRVPRTEAPADLLAFSCRAAQPDNLAGEREHVSTAEFAAGLARLEAWCLANGRERLVVHAAQWSETLRPID